MSIHALSVARVVIQSVSLHWVFIPGYGMNKINAAFSFGGPSLYVETIEYLTSLRMDHLAIIDWNGFKSLTNALGGVEIYVPESGSRMLDGEGALRYVRTRYGLENGDFDQGSVRSGVD